MTTARLLDVVRTTPRTRLLTMAVDAAPFTFRAGQALFAGVTGSGARAAYSIASPPALAREGRLELLVPADGAFGQDGLDPASVAGATIDLEGPFGGFGVPEAASGAPLLLVAGGTGIAPIRSIVHDRLADPAHGPVALVYSVRTPDEFAFADEFVALEAEGRLTLHATVTRDVQGADGGRRLGRVDEALLRGALPATSAWCFVCGPSGFVHAVTATLDRLGVPAERQVIER